MRPWVIEQLLPEAPQYFQHNAAMNRVGPDLVNWRQSTLPTEPDDDLANPADAYVVDVRDAEAFAAGHIPNSVNIGIRGRFETWVGIMVPWDAKLVLAADSEDELTEAIMRLHRVGYQPKTILMDTWRDAGKTLVSHQMVKPQELYDAMQTSESPLIVDVRLPTEWMGLRIGATANIPLNELATGAKLLSKDLPIVTVCNSAYRSSLAAGVLQREGFTNVSNMDGGSQAWIDAGLPVIQPTSPDTAAASTTAIAARDLRLPHRLSATELHRMMMDLPTMIGITALVGMGWLELSQLHLMPTVYGAHAIGGLLFGVGFVMSGWCPGTGAVGLASGKLDALVFLVGIMIGSIAFNESFAWVEPLYLWGVQAEPSFAFGLPTTLFVFLFSVAGVAAFYACERLEIKRDAAGSYFHSPFLKAFSLCIVGTSAALFILPDQTDEAVAAHRSLKPAMEDNAAFLSMIEAGGDHIEPETVAKRLMLGDDSLHVVDVRSQAEFERMHIRGAVNVPLLSLFDEKRLFDNMRLFDQGRTVVLYSNGMTHPAQARDRLAASRLHRRLFAHRWVAGLLGPMSATGVNS